MSDHGLCLRCEGLRKSFGGTVALADVNLRLPDHGIIAIIGPNGAGKTTLFNVLTGFVRPETGRFFVGDLELTGRAAHQIAQLGIGRTFQDLRLIKLVSVLDNVMLARQNQKGERLLLALLRIGVSAEEVRNHDEALSQLGFVGLDSKANECAGNLSYGQQKLVTLACCLASGARILLLDEPIAGVDVGMAPHILRLLKDIGEQGRLVVFIEHDLVAVRQIADLVVVMDGGRIIAQGIPSDVLQRKEIIEAYVN